MAEKHSSPKRLFETALTAVSTSDLEGVGTLRWSGENCYRWVQNKHSAAVTVGQVVFHTFTDGRDALQKVRDGATADLGFMAGIVMGASVAADSYGWIQVLGINETASVLGDTNAAPNGGDFLIGVNAQLYASGQAPVAMGTAPTYSRGLLLVETLTSMTTAAATAVNVYVQCL